MTHLRSSAVAMFSLSVSILGCGGATPAPQTAEDTVESEPETFAIALRFEDGGTDENETPHTTVALVRIAPDGERTVTELGREVGACYHEDSSGALIAGRCWWGGEGGRYALRREGDAVVAYRVEVHEETGSLAPREVGRIDVPADAQLQILAPTGGAAPAL